jgi:hypothetical protein
VLVAAIGFPLAGGTIMPVSIGLRAVAPALFFLGIAVYRWRKERRLADVLVMVFWSLTFGALYLPLMYLAARCPVFFQDDVLSGMDRALGVEVPDVRRLTDRFPEGKRFLAAYYDTLLFLITAAIMLPPLCGRMYRAKEYLLACIASSILGISLRGLASTRSLVPLRVYGDPGAGQGHAGHHRPQEGGYLRIEFVGHGRDHFVPFLPYRARSASRIRLVAGPVRALAGSAAGWPDRPLNRLALPDRRRGRISRGRGFLRLGQGVFSPGSPVRSSRLCT